MIIQLDTKNIYRYTQLISSSNRYWLQIPYTILRFTTFQILSSRVKVDMSFEMNVMYSSLFDAVFADSFFSPMRTVYVVSDSQLEEIKRNQREEELEKIETSRKRLEENYQARVKVLNDREHKLKEEIKALAPSKNKKEKVTA